MVARCSTSANGPSATSRDGPGWRLSDVKQKLPSSVLVYEFTAQSHSIGPLPHPAHACAVAASFWEQLNAGVA